MGGGWVLGGQYERREDARTFDLCAFKCSPRPGRADSKEIEATSICPHGRCIYGTIIKYELFTIKYYLLYLDPILPSSTSLPLYPYNKPVR